MTRPANFATGRISQISEFGNGLRIWQGDCEFGKVVCEFGKVVCEVGKVVCEVGKAANFAS